MKNRSLLKILSGVLVAGLMVSCGKMESDADSSAPDLNTGEDNYVDLAVTGGVASTSYTCAEIIGYANLGPLALAGVEFGVLVSEDTRPDEGNSARIKASSLEDGRAFSVLVSRSTGKVLRPDETYYYRSYVLSAGVYVLGKIESFRTPEVPASFMKVEEVFDVGYDEATVDFTFNAELVHKKDDYSFGLLVTGEDDFKREYTDCRYWTEDVLRVTVDGLTSGKEYKCRPFVCMGEKDCMSDDAMTFSTKSADGVIRLEAAYDVTRVSAKNKIVLDKSMLAGKDYSVSIYYSTNKDQYTTGDGQELMYWYSTTDYIGSEIVASPTHLDFGTKYYVWASLTFDNSTIKTQVQTFTTKGLGSQTSVDMGGSVKWSNKNLGASNPEEVGNYYAWGEVSPRTYLDEDYKWYDYSRKRYTKYCDSSNWGTVDKKSVLDPEDDAAHVALGGKWRMPTYAEFNELNEGCVWTQTGKDGVRGLLCEASNGNAIFFPCSGYITKYTKYKEDYAQIWTSSASNAPKSWCMAGLVINYSNDYCSSQDDYRTSLRPIRPVCD